MLAPSAACFFGRGLTPLPRSSMLPGMQAILAKINEALSKRQDQEQKATSNGRTDIASAIQKIITDLNNMKTAINNKDKAAFKTANEQRKQDREALKALRKADKAKNTKTSGSTTTPAPTTKP